MNESELLLESEKFLKELLIEKLPDDSRIFLFGSRAAGSHGFSSDFDIGIMSNNLDRQLLLELTELIEESFVPFKVDLVDFSSVDDKFKKRALEKTIEWK